MGLDKEVALEADMVEAVDEEEAAGVGVAVAEAAADEEDGSDI